MRGTPQGTVCQSRGVSADGQRTAGDGLRRRDEAPEGREVSVRRPAVGPGGPATAG
jgi:hypothetical protein